MSFLLLATDLKWRGNLPTFSQLRSISLKLVAIATILLASNYILFVKSLAITTAANPEVLIQLAPLLIGLGGLVIFKEPYT